jgi:hypothetical protein
VLLRLAGGLNSLLRTIQHEVIDTNLLLTWLDQTSRVASDRADLSPTQLLKRVFLRFLLGWLNEWLLVLAHKPAAVVE